MHTRTQFLSIPLPTVALAALLRSFANRPTLSRRLQRRADLITRELEWRANAAMNS
jgi:hypothetical protein